MITNHIKWLNCIWLPSPDVRSQRQSLHLGANVADELVNVGEALLDLADLSIERRDLGSLDRFDALEQQLPPLLQRPQMQLARLVYLAGDGVRPALHARDRQRRLAHTLPEHLNDVCGLAEQAVGGAPRLR